MHVQMYMKTPNKERNTHMSNSLQKSSSDNTGLQSAFSVETKHSRGKWEKQAASTEPKCNLWQSLSA